MLRNIHSYCIRTGSEISNKVPGLCVRYVHTTSSSLSIIYCQVRGNKIVGEPLSASPRALAADYLALHFASKRTIIYQNKR